MSARNLLSIIAFIQIQSNWCFPFYSKQYKVIVHNDQRETTAQINHELDGIIDNSELHKTNDDGTLSGIYEQIQQTALPPKLLKLWSWVRQTTNIRKFHKHGSDDCNLFMVNWDITPQHAKGYDWALCKGDSVLKNGEYKFYKFQNDEHQRISVLHDQLQKVTIIGDKDLFDDAAFMENNSYVLPHNSEIALNNKWITQLELDRMRTYNRDYPYLPDQMAVRCIKKHTLENSIGSLAAIDINCEKVNDFYSHKALVAYGNDRMLPILGQRWNIAELTRQDVFSYTADDQSKVLYLYPTRTTSHDYLWALLFDGQMLTGVCKSSTSFEWDSPGAQIVFTNGKNVNEQLVDSFGSIKKLQMTLDESIALHMEIAAQKRKMLLNLTESLREYPFYPDKYEIVCQSARTEDPCAVLRGVYHQIEDGVYDYQMNRGGVNMPFLEWFSTGVNIGKTLEASDLQRYANGKGGILHIAHDVESHKNYGYCLQMNQVQTVQRIGSSETSDSFEREINGIHLFINNAVSAEETIHKLLELKQNEIDEDVKDDVNPFNIDVYNIKDVMLIITSSFLCIIIIVAFIKQCICCDSDDDLGMTHLQKRFSNANGYPRVGEHTEKHINIHGHSIACELKI